MGCWNEKIYGGDASIEWRENMYKFCGAKEYDSKNKIKAIPLKVLTSKIDGLIKILDSDREEDDRNIGYLVLGALIMHSGFDFDDIPASMVGTNTGLIDRVVLAADEDDWASENQVRALVMKNFKQLIKEYNPSEPFNIETVNVLEEKEDEEEIIQNEFKPIFAIMNARIKKLKRGIEEKSGNKEFDEGFADASKEEIDFIIDFKDMMATHERLAIVLDRIDKGVGITEYSGGIDKGSSARGNGDMNGGKDIVAG
jgi:hypothetical protein